MSKTELDAARVHVCFMWVAHVYVARIFSSCISCFVKNDFHTLLLADGLRYVKAHPSCLPKHFTVFTGAEIS